MVLQFKMFPTADVPKTNAGSRVKKTYKLVYESDGTRNLVHDSYEDIYEKIQMHKDSVDIHHVVDMCLRGLPVNVRYGDYGDISEAPKSYAEVLNQLATSERIFKNLPAEVKEKFDNSVSKFYATAFTDGWIEKLGLTHNDMQKIAEAKASGLESEVTVDE